MAGKTDAYIDARFDILAEDAAKPKDKFADTVKNGVQHTVSDGDAESAAYAKYLADFNPSAEEAV